MALNTDKLRTALSNNYDIRTEGWTVRRIFHDDNFTSLKDCYVNLSIIYQKERHEIEHMPWNNILHTQYDSDTATFKLDNDFIKLENIFQNFSHEKNNRTLIIGRAGIGKSTLCQKVTYEYYKSRRWWDKFDILLWISLRDLIQYVGKVETRKDIQNKLIENHFQNATLQDIEHLKETLFDSGNKLKTLFLLDGLDEIASCFHEDTLKEFVNLLVKQKNVVVTSRPYMVNLIIDEFDLKLETVGFTWENVTKYLKIKFSKNAEKSEDIKNYVGENRVLRGLVNIPIQLNILCYCWDIIVTRDNSPLTLTLTAIFKKMLEKLKTASAMRIQKFFNTDICNIVNDLLLDFLEFLAFKMSFSMLKDEKKRKKKEKYSHFIEFNTSFLNETMTAFQLLNVTRFNNSFIPDFENAVKQTFFLYTQDLQLNEELRRYHFIHLIFQDFFAANYIAKSFMKNSGNSKQFTIKDKYNVEHIITENKYNPRYEIIWWFVAGIIKSKKQLVDKFFDLLEQAPEDIVGTYHHLLILGCSNECDLPPERKDRLFREYYERICLEYKFFGDTWLTKRQLPNSIIQRLLKLVQNEQDKQFDWTVKAFEYISLPDEFLLDIINLLFSECDVIKSRAREILANRKLPTVALQYFIERLQNCPPGCSIWGDPLSDKLEWSKDQPIERLIDLLINLLKNVDRQFASETLHHQSRLSPGSVAKLIGMLKNADKRMKYTAARILEHQEQFDDQSFQELFNMLENDLSDETRKIVSEKLTSLMNRHEFKYIWLQLNNPPRDDLTNSLYAHKILLHQRHLSSCSVAKLIETLKNAEITELIRCYVQEILVHQKQFDDRSFDELFNMLKTAKLKSSATYVLENHTKCIHYFSENQIKQMNSLLEWEAFIALAALECHNNLPSEIILKLLELMETSQDEKCRTRSVLLLGIQNDLPIEKRKIVIDQLTLLKGHESEEIQRRATNCLNHLTPQSCSSGILESMKADAVKRLINILKEIAENQNFTNVHKVEKILCTLIDSILDHDMRHYANVLLSRKDIHSFMDPVDIQIMILEVLLVFGYDIHEIIIEFIYRLLKSEDSHAQYRAARFLRNMNSFQDSLDDAIVEQLIMLLDLSFIDDDFLFDCADKDSTLVLSNQLNINEENFKHLIQKLSPHIEQEGRNSHIEQEGRKGEKINNSIHNVAIILQNKPVQQLLENFEKCQDIINFKLFLKVLLLSQCFPTPATAIYFKEGESNKPDMLCFYNAIGFCTIKIPKHSFLKDIREARYELGFPVHIDVITRFLTFNERTRRKECYKNIIFDNGLVESLVKQDSQKQFLKFEFFEHNDKDKGWSAPMNLMLEEKLESHLSNQLWIHLDLSNNHLTDDQFVILYGILKNKGKHIHSLNLSHNMISEKFLTDFFEAIANCPNPNCPNCPKLLYVFLDFNHIYLEEATYKALFECRKGWPKRPVMDYLPNMKGIDLSMNFIPHRMLKPRNGGGNYNVLCLDGINVIPNKNEIAYSVLNCDKHHTILDLKRDEDFKIDNKSGCVALVEWKSKLKCIHVSKHQFILIEQFNSDISQQKLLRAELFKENDDDFFKINICDEYALSVLFLQTNNLQNMSIRIKCCSMDLIKDLKEELDESRSTRFHRYSCLPLRQGHENCGTWAMKMLRKVKIDLPWSCIQD